jgi:hypothetical protein
MAPISSPFSCAVLAILAPTPRDVRALRLVFALGAVSRRGLLFSLANSAALVRLRARLPSSSVIMIATQIYKLYIPDLYGVFATNPVAAMPSLHVAGTHLLRH